MVITFHKILLGASLLLLLCAPVGNAYAAGEYGVDNVVADADGKDTTDARTKALANGEKDAFVQLIKRLNPSSAAKIIADTKPSQINVMVRGFSVVDEKMTADHYHATINYSFDPHQIQALLPASPAAAAAATPQVAGDSAPAASEHKRKAVLVLPVYNEAGSLELWQDENKWRNIWYEAALESGGGLVVVPQGDINDRVDVDDSNVSTATPASLKRMYDHYGVGDIIVLTAFFNRKADPKPTLEVSMRKLSDPKATLTPFNYTIHSTENLDTLLVRASNDIARILYKQQTIDPNKIEYDRLKEINARVNTTSITEWEALRNRLLTHGNIVGIRFVSISYYETTMIITYKGTADTLGKTLVASGLRVMQDGDSFVLALK